MKEISDSLKDFQSKMLNKVQEFMKEYKQLFLQLYFWE